MYLFWKAKAVLSLQVISLLLACTLVSWGQSKVTLSNNAYKKITLSFNQIPGEEALQRLARNTNISFVYSTSILDLKKRVSLNASKQPLEEILEIVGQQLSLTFKFEGDYVVVKKSLDPPRANKTKLTSTENVITITKVDTDTDSNTHTPDATIASSSPATFYSVSLKKSDYENSLSEVDSSLSQRTIKFIPKLILPATEKSDKRKKWFASANIFVSDFALGGLEMQGGIRSLYAVVNTSRVSSNLYRVGYGVGTNLSLSRYWSVQLIYTTAQIKKQNRDSIFRDNITFTSWHHQLKLMAQYHISPRISIRAGATVNVLNTRYKFGGEDIPVVFNKQQPRDFQHHDFRTLRLSQELISSGTIIPQHTLTNSYSDNYYLNTKTWIGFEVGVSYKINFSLHQ